jgi:3-hydroxybutyryl-CoA dehydratase
MRFEALAVGMSAETSHQVTDAIVRQFADVTGDHNPAHLDEAYAATTRFGGRTAHGMLGAGFISACIATELPGPGTIYISQSLRFLRPVRIGDTVTARVEVVELFAARRRVRLTTTCRNQAGEVVMDGDAMCLVPERS